MMKKRRHRSLSLEKLNSVSNMGKVRYGATIRAHSNIHTGTSKKQNRYTGCLCRPNARWLGIDLSVVEMKR